MGARRAQRPRLALPSYRIRHRFRVVLSKIRTVPGKVICLNTFVRTESATTTVHTSERLGIPIRSRYIQQVTVLHAPRQS